MSCFSIFNNFPYLCNMNPYIILFHKTSRFKGGIIAQMISPLVIKFIPKVQAFLPIKHHSTLPLVRKSNTSYWKKAKLQGQQARKDGKTSHADPNTDKLYHTALTYFHFSSKNQQKQLIYLIYLQAPGQMITDTCICTLICEGWVHNLGM